MVVGYSPNERNGEERERLWNDLDRVGNRGKLCVLEDLNVWIGERVKLV